MFRTTAIRRVNVVGFGLEEMLSEQVKQTSVETTRAEALQADLSKANLEKVTTQSKVVALQAEVAKILASAK